MPLNQNRVCSTKKLVSHLIKINTAYLRCQSQPISEVYVTMTMWNAYTDIFSLPLNWRFKSLAVS